MYRANSTNDFLAIYYCVYLAACGFLTTWLGLTLHSAGRTFLTDSFTGNRGLARAVGRLLDIGFYLLCAGYVALSYQTNCDYPDLGMALKVAIVKLGGLLLLLGVAHMLNVLVLAVLRERRHASAQN
jgi:hypothetical protein